MKQFYKTSLSHKQVASRDEAIVGWGVGGRFFKKNQYINNILFLAICFNKIALCPLNNIIDIFKSYKKIYQTKIKPKLHPKTNTRKKPKNKIKADSNQRSNQPRSRRTPNLRQDTHIIKRKKKGISMPLKEKNVFMAKDLRPKELGNGTIEEQQCSSSKGRPVTNAPPVHRSSQHRPNLVIFYPSLISESLMLG